MSCCGQKRSTFYEKTAGQPFELSEPTPTGPPAGSIFFEYVGNAAMTVVGPATGRSYRFGWPGAHVAVELKDARSIAAGVPNLREVAV